MAAESDYHSGSLFGDGKKRETYFRICNTCDKEIKSKNRFKRFCDNCRRHNEENSTDKYLEEVTLGRL